MFDRNTGTPELYAEGSSDVPRPEIVSPETRLRP